MTVHDMTAGRGVLGRPIDRVEGPLKVRGAARYAYEVATAGHAAYGVILGAGIARGRILAIDTAAAEAAPGVRLVLTHKTMPPQPEFGPPVPPQGVQPFTRPRPVLADDRIRFFDEPVALVVADTFEAARGAARLVKVEYAPEAGAFTLRDRLGEAYDPKTINAGFKSESVIGEPEAAIAAADIQVDAVFHNDFEHHAPLEPHAALASWDGDELTVRYGGQNLAPARATIAATLGIKPEKVRLLSPYIGGGFGSKIIAHAETTLAAFAAKALGRPVKVAFTRQQMFANAGHRPQMHQRIRLGATREGKLTGFAYDVTMTTARMEEFGEQTAVFARNLYAAPNRATRHRLVPVDVRRAEVMRAPGEAPGLMAFEAAIDELCEKLGMDPVAFRIANEPTEDPEKHVPFSTRRLVECLEVGAAQFGWEAGPPRPRARREGRKLIGRGVSAGIRPNYIRASAARVRLDRDGRAIVETDMTDIGNGSYTILTQIVAEELGLALQDVEVRLGDSRLPTSAGSGGSFGAASSGTAVTLAVRALREKVAAAALGLDGSPLRGANDRDVRFADGQIRAGGMAAPLAALVAILPEEALAAEGRAEVPPTYREFSQHSYAAFFAEVEVDADTAEVRMRRMLGVFDAGRVLNPQLARSQLIGGMIWGIGAALMEGSEIDPRLGAFMNADLANYHVMAHADVPDIEAIVLDGYDDKANPMGAKGIGELGICGSGGAVANAVYAATGVRPRAFPITVDRLLAVVPEP